MRLPRLSMTKIDFYIHAEHKLRTACVLSHKAMQAGVRTTLSFPDEEMLRAFDQLLWRYPPTGFVPHCRSDEVLAPNTPVLLHCGTAALPDHQLLISLHPDIVPFFSRFERVIELVGLEETDKQQGRSRYKFYRDRGYALQNIDLSKGERA